MIGQGPLSCFEDFSWKVVVSRLCFGLPLHDGRKNLQPVQLNRINDFHHTQSTILGHDPGFSPFLISPILNHALFPLTPDFVGSNSFPVMFQGLFGSISFPRAVPCLMKDSFLG